MIDRLNQLRSMAGIMGNSYSEQELDLHVKQEKYQDDDTEIQFSQKFAEQIKSVRSMIGGLNSNNKKIQSIKNHYAKAIKSAQQRQNSCEMNDILQENADYQKKIKQKLIDIQASVKESQKNQANQPETRMKRNFYLNLSKEVSQVLLKQQKFQEEYKTMVKEKATRQIKLIDRNLTEEEAQDIVNKPGQAQRLLEKRVFGASLQLKNTVSDLQDKLNDIKKLEASVNQCVQLFNQLSVLVFAQGQKIDSIQANVAQCKDYIESAQKKLQKGKEHLQCSKKCMCCIAIIALIILVIIVIVVLAAN